MENITHKQSIKASIQKLEAAPILTEEEGEALRDLYNELDCQQCEGG